MKTRSLFFTLLCIPSVVCLEIVSLGKISLQLKSTEESDPSFMIAEFLQLSTAFLEEHFISEYSSQNFIQLRLNSPVYDISPGTNGGYLSAVEIRGTAVFKEAPEADQVHDSLMSALQEDSLNYLEILSSSNDPFLSNISYAIVRVAPSEPKQEDTPKFDTWVVALLAGAGAFVVVFSLCLLCICLTPVDAPIEKKMSQATKEVGDEESNSISPVRSFTSQDSSLFTYNPKLSRVSKDKTADYPSFMTNPNDVSDVTGDWHNQNSFKVGISDYDISKIENKTDLSLIEEVDHEDVTPVKDNSTYSKISSLLYPADKTSSKKSKVVNARPSDKAKLDLSGTSKDVLSELNDLSQQINKMRTTN